MRRHSSPTQHGVTNSLSFIFTVFVSRACVLLEHAQERVLVKGLQLFELEVQLRVWLMTFISSVLLLCDILRHLRRLSLHPHVVLHLIGRSMERS